MKVRARKTVIRGRSGVGAGGGWRKKDKRKKRRGVWVVDGQAGRQAGRQNDRVGIED